MAVWPVTLPQEPLIEGFDAAAVDDTLRSEVDRGPHQSRPLFTGNYSIVQMNQLLTTAQKDTLLAFYRTTLARGSLPFDWGYTYTGGVAKEHTFMSMPTWAPVSHDKWKCHYQFMVRDL